MRLPRAERRDQIIDVAAGVFLVAGFDGTSLEEVAKAAGVTRLVVYRIFESKERLYRAVLSSVTDDLNTEFEGADILEIRRRGGIVRVMLTIARRHPDAFRLLWRQASREPLFAPFSGRFRSVLASFAQGVILFDGRIVTPVFVQWCSTVLSSHLLDGICAWLDTGDAARDDEYVVIQTAGLFAMLGAWADPHAPSWTAPSVPAASE